MAYLEQNECKITVIESIFINDLDNKFVTNFKCYDCLAKSGEYANKN